MSDGTNTPPPGAGETPRTDVVVDNLSRERSWSFKVACLSTLARTLERALATARREVEEARRDAKRYEAKRLSDYHDWIDHVAAVHRGPSQSQAEWMADYDEEMDDYVSALASRGATPDSTQETER